jgi:hypothetical protein
LTMLKREQKKCPLHSGFELIKATFSEKSVH